MRTAAGIALLAAVTLGALHGAATAPIACESLAQLDVTNGRVLSAESMPAGGFTPPNTTNASAAAAFTTLPAFCRVTLKLTPSSDSDIRVEVWLPQAGWNRKLQASGNGGAILEPSRHMRDVLLAKGYEVHYQQFNSGHDYLNWRGTLADGLIALVGTDSARRPSP